MNGFEMRFRAAGNDYDAALERTAGDTELLGQLMLMFKSDGGFAALSKALEEDNCRAAFAAAHSLKGSSGMLGMDPLFAVMSEITEALRAGELEPAKTAFPKAKDEYEKGLAIIGELC